MLKFSMFFAPVFLSALMMIGCGNDDPTTPPTTGGSSTLTWSYVDGGTKYSGVGTGGDHARLAPFNSKLYSAWVESAHVRVSVYNGNDSSPGWAYVDGGSSGISTDAGSSSENPQLTVFNSKLYAVWKESTGGASQVRVAVYNGNDSAPGWVFVDGSGTSGTNIGINFNIADSASYPQLVVSGSKLYATWQERSGGGDAVHIAVYNGNDPSPSWQFVDGGGIAYTNSGGNANPQLVVLDSRLYLAYQADIGIEVKVYNGNDGAPAWMSVTGPGGQLYRINEGSSFPQLAVFNSKLYIIWLETLDIAYQPTIQVRVAVYGGNDSTPDWTYLDSNGPYGINKNPGKSVADPPQLLVHGSRLYAIWAEDLPDVDIRQIRVAAYNGNDSSPAWNFVDKGEYGINFDPFKYASSPHMTVFNSKIYSAWTEVSIRMAVAH